MAFEADELDSDLRLGWSVTVVGHGRLITDVDHLVEIAGVWPRPWAGGAREHFIEIEPER